MKMLAESRVPGHVPYIHLGYTSAMAPDFGPLVVVWGTLLTLGGIAVLGWLLVAVWRALGPGRETPLAREWRGIRAARLESQKSASLPSPGPTR
jgi:hypothetical protein